MRDTEFVIRQLPHEILPRLPAPEYLDAGRKTKIGLAVESMRRHTTDEGFQIFQGLEHNGYKLCGNNLSVNSTDIPTIFSGLKPGTAVIQDKREWEFPDRDFREKSDRFTGYEKLKGYNKTFKLTILKDSHARPWYHRQSAEEMDVHAWIIYYHPKIVTHLATYVRPEHLIRTYHSLDPEQVPEYAYKHRSGTLLSGAISSAYPLRGYLMRRQRYLQDIHYLKHPGYHARGCETPMYLKLLGQFKVAICTSSIYGYALRKIIEATACGCIVITDLPTDEVLPEIDGNLVRIEPTMHVKFVGDLLKELYRSYDPDRQYIYAQRAKRFYDYKEVTRRLANDIERMRSAYSTSSVSG